MSMAGTASAGPVDEAEALNVATLFISGGAVYKSAKQVESISPFYTKGRLTYYVVNYVGEGFVVVSGDDCYYPILAYSHDSHFDTYDIPPAAQLWLDNLAYGIDSLARRNYSSEEIRREWENPVKIWLKQITKIDFKLNN